MRDELIDLRVKIKDIDSQILRLIRDRLEFSRKIGEIKRKNDYPIIDLKVEAKVVERALNQARDFGLDEEFSRRLVNNLIIEAVRTQGVIIEDRARHLYSVLERVKELESEGVKVIRLDVGEPDLAAPGKVKDALRDNLYRKKYVGYTSSKGLEELREGIANELNAKYGTDITKENVLVTTGGKLSIFTAILSKIASGDRVVIPHPAWPVYENCTRLVNGRVDLIRTCVEEEWAIDIERVEEAFKVRPKLFILCNPNNPTGKIIPDNDLNEVLQIAERNKVCVLTDEVYSSYSYKPFKSVLQLTDSNYIYVNSFSKRFGLTGWRVGYAVADVETISRMHRIIQISVTCVPEFIQRGALEALTINQIEYRAFAARMKERVNIACEELDKLPLHYLKPDGGMYIFPKTIFDGFQSRHFAHRLLNEKGVSIVPGEAFGEYPEHFRISLGRDVKDIRAGLKIMGQMIEKWPRL